MGVALLVAAPAGAAAVDLSRADHLYDVAEHRGPARANPVARWRVEIGQAAARFGVPTAWIEWVMRAESGGRTMLGGQPITSSAGAMGLMQLMPATWGAMRVAHGLGDDPHDPRDNILAGTAYLRAMYDRFGYPGLFAAYNAGPGRYAAYLRSGLALPGETRAYLAKLADSAAAPLETAALSPHPPSSPSLFVVLRTGDPSGEQAPPQMGNGRPDGAKTDPLFAVRIWR